MEERDMTRRELWALLAEKTGTLPEEWDNDGLLVGEGNAPVSSVLLTLDATEAAIARAKERGHDLILSHHPLIFRPLKRVTDGGVSGRVFTLAREGIGLISCHTRLDRAHPGVGDALAAALGLKNPCPVGDYAVVGEVEETDAAALAGRVKTALSAPFVRFADGGRPIRTVAVMGGAGEAFLPSVQADAFVTGEAGYHTLTDAVGQGVTLIEAGHYHTEFPVLALLREWLLAWGIQKTEIFSSDLVGAC
jgi:dinuclear metal center YbgI/SA1388 family protein